MLHIVQTTTRPNILVSLPTNVPAMLSEMPTNSPEHHVGSPERFARDPPSCEAFITKLPRLLIQSRHLTVRVPLWGAEEWPACLHTFAAEVLLILCHGEQSIMNYAIDFRIVALRIPH